MTLSAAAAVSILSSAPWDNNYVIAGVVLCSAITFHYFLEMLPKPFINANEVTLMALFIMFNPYNTSYNDINRITNDTQKAITFLQNEAHYTTRIYNYAFKRDATQSTLSQRFAKGI